jgi:hypothetical protein
MNRFTITLLTVSFTSFLAAAGTAAVMTFDSEPLGKQYGAPVGDPPGVPVLVENNIQMSMFDFFWFPGPGSTYNFAEIVAPPSPLAVNASKALNTNNINAVFDFSALGPVKVASVEFVELGGNVNFEINTIGGTSLQNVQDLPALVSPPGFNVLVNSVPVPGGYRGVIEVLQTGPNPIESLLIGGQELGIDNVRSITLGDMNEDGKVNGLDVEPFVDVLLNGLYQSEADMNLDDKINGLDVEPFVHAVLADGGTVEAIPEPSAAVLATIGLLGWFAYRYRRPK